MTVHSNEDLLDEILRLFPVADRSIYEVQEARLIALHQFLEGTLFTAEKRPRNRRVIEGMQPLSYRRSRQRRPFNCELSHIDFPLLSY
jgi:hypothetical protein